LILSVHNATGGHWLAMHTKTILLAQAMYSPVCVVAELRGDLVASNVWLSLPIRGA
jgi:hypothetical protein